MRLPLLIGQKESPRQPGRAVKLQPAHVAFVKHHGSRAARIERKNRDGAPVAALMR